MPSYYGITTRLPSPPSGVVVEQYVPEVDLLVSNPAVTTDAVVSLFRAETELLISAINLNVSPLLSQQVGFYRSESELFISDPVLIANAETSQTAALYRAETDLLVSDVNLEVGQFQAQTIALSRAEASLAVKDPPLTADPAVGTTVALSRAEAELYFSDVQLTVTPAGAQTIALNRAETSLGVKDPPLNVSPTVGTTVDLRRAETNLLVANVPLAAATPGAVTAPLYRAETGLFVSNPQLLVETPGATTVGLTRAETNLLVSDPPLVASLPTAATISLFRAETNLLVSNPALTVQAPTSTTVPLYRAETELRVGDVTLDVEDVVPPPNEAACFSAPSYMYSDPIFGYLLTVDNGYINVWFRFTGSEDPGAHKMIVFSIANNLEERFQFGLGRHGNTTVPDLFIERSDLPRPSYAELWTYLEEENSQTGRPVPDLYDGEWHMLTWGNEKLDVDGTPYGWYFWIDGQQYGIAPYQFVPGGAIGDQDEWFAEAGFYLDTLWDRLDTGAVTAYTPGPAEQLIGCIDELMVVNTRTIGLRGGIGGEVTGDMEYLFNQRFGRLIEQVEADNENGLWNDVYNAWKFEVSDVGHEYKNPTGLGTHNLPNQSNIASSAGIPGAGVVSISADLDSALANPIPTPHLYTPYQVDGPMSHSSNEISVVIWYRPAEAVTTSSFSQALAGVMDGTASEWILYRTTVGDWRFTTYGTLGSRTTNISTLRTMDVNKWYMITATFSISTVSMHIWWDDNGATYATHSISGGTVNRNTGSQFRVGTRGATNHWPARGWIDDVLYFNHLMPNLGASGSMEWLFNDGPGRSIANIQSNDITLYNQIGSHWSMNETGDGTQQRLDDAAGTGSALAQYGTSVSLLTLGNVGTGTGHIVD